MKNSKKSKMIFGLILILLIILLICLLTLTIVLKNAETKEEPDLQVVSQTTPKTIQDVVENHDAIYIYEERRKIYVNFPKDLYEENGQSNREYFEELIEDLIELEELTTRTFYLIDEEKYISIEAKYDSVSEKHIITYNEMENFFEENNAENYTKVDKVQIIDKVELNPAAKEFYNLVSGSLFFTTIEKSIGEGVDLGNSFTSYKDGSILLKIANGRVKTIIFTEKYKTDIFHGITVGTDLSTIESKYKGYISGSAADGYIMFRTKDVYAFFYEDQIVIYGYSYFYNEYFEDILEEYVTTLNLQSFVEGVTKKWSNYEICEYDFDAGTAHITYPSRGVDINITNNNPLGITLYKNYYFTNRTKTLVKNGKISLNDTEDYIEKFEKERKENFERVTNE